MENPSIMSHVSIGTNDFERAAKFYDAVLKTIGGKRIYDLSEHKAIAYGKVYPEFWVQVPHNGKEATIGNGAHFAFYVKSKEEVHAFYDEALRQGASDDGAPGPRPHYGEQYYGCFVRDLDGNKIEAMFYLEVR